MSRPVTVVAMDRLLVSRRQALQALSVSASALTGACTFHGSLLTPYAPSMWLAQSPNARVNYTLLGSVHQGSWRFYPLPAVVEHEFSRSRGLLVELESRRRFQELVTLFTPLVRQPAGRTLEDDIGPAQMARLLTLLRADRELTQRLQSLRPWAAALELHTPADLRLQTHTRQGLDTYFLDEAYRRNKPVFELETAQEQVYAMSGGNTHEQVTLLNASLDSLSAWEEVLKNIIDAWRVGDDDKLAQLRERHFPQSGPARAYRERMLSVRDSTMARRLLAHSQQDAHPTNSYFFVLVGAMHLVGQHNMRDELERLGFRLSRLSTSA
jgi:uncharacterized protein